MNGTRTGKCYVTMSNESCVFLVVSAVLLYFLLITLNVHFEEISESFGAFSFNKYNTFQAPKNVLCNKK